MIETTKAYRVGEKTFGTLEEAQIHEITEILCFDPDIQGIDPAVKSQTHRNVAGRIVANRERVLDVLTTGPRSKPKARSINGGTKRRKSAQETTKATP